MPDFRRHLGPLPSTETAILRPNIGRSIAAAVRVAPFFALGNCEELFIVAVLSVSWKALTRVAYVS